MPEVTIIACTADPVKDQEPPSSRRSSSASLVKGDYFVIQAVYKINSKGF